MSNKVLLELLKKLRIPSSLGSSIVADKSSTDPVSTGPDVIYKKKKAQRKYDSRKVYLYCHISSGKTFEWTFGQFKIEFSLLTFKLLFKQVTGQRYQYSMIKPLL